MRGPYTLYENSRQKCFVFLSALLLSLNLFAQPTITSFAPASGPVGTTVTITGTNFNTTPANNIVFFGMVKASVTSASTTSLTVTVPAGATFLPISIATNNLTAYSNKPFIVTFPGAAPVFTAKSFEFEAQVDSVDPSIETTKYTLGDVDGDGKVDVITVDRLNNSMSVYRNTTSGSNISFAAKIDYATGQSPRAVTVGDINGDGKPDIIVSNLSDNTVSVYRNTSAIGTISLAARVDFTTQTQPATICITDLDKDGKPDMVVNTVNLNGYISILRNTSVGSVISFASHTEVQAVGGSDEEVRTADMDGDGKSDIVIPNTFFNSVTIFRNTSTTGNISFASPVNFTASAYPDNIEVGDFDNDGKPDVAVGHLTNSNLMIFWNRSTPGTISLQNTYTTEGGNSVSGFSIDNFDGDGKPDLAADIGLESIFMLQNTSTPGLINFNLG
ncbi:MAG: FG-GAP repeat domain-containing protein, partial [Chitinophagales bacterium]